MLVLEKAINEKDAKTIRDIVNKIPIAHVADEIEKLSIQRQLIFFRLLETNVAAKIFSSLDISYQKKLAVAFAQKETLEILDELYSDELVDILEEVPTNIAKMIIQHTPKEKRDVINHLLRYDENSVGSIMVVDIIVLKQTWNCRRALFEIKKNRSKAQISSYYYVRNNKGFLVGAVAMDELFFAPPSQPIANMVTTVHAVNTHDDIESTSLVFRDHDLPSLPVVNSENILVGMVTSDDIIDVLEEEATEDFQKMAGIDPLEDPYFATSIFKLVRSRIFWLLFLMISATISQIVLDVFIGITDRTFPANNSAAQVVSASVTTMLVTIIPVISGAAGNAGSQSSTMITRGLAVKEVELGDYYRILWREFRIGIVVGALLGVTNFVRLIIYYAAKTQTVNSLDLWIAFGASLSLVVVITIAKLVGGLLPIIAKLFHQDPAVMAAPLISTLTDALSSVLFFSINIAILLLVLPHT